MFIFWCIYFLGKGKYDSSIDTSIIPEYLASISSSYHHNITANVYHMECIFEESFQCLSINVIISVYRLGHLEDLKFSGAKKCLPDSWRSGEQSERLR